ncbi:MAG: hypothetical protein VKQ33_11875 [Candidatus Sericytochromatia bacterium]|nr:hypothetical protein [Candidatus Sericytochromatia bacterium]
MLAHQEFLAIRASSRAEALASVARALSASAGGAPASGEASP